MVMDSETISAHASGYPSGIREKFGLAFLRAFTDDSAAQGGDRRLFFAGYLHRADVWALFLDDWNTALKAHPGIEYFKGSEANNLDGEFHFKKGWTQPKRDAKVDLLSEIIRHYEPFSFEFSVNRQIFEDELKPVSPYGFGRPHFQMCVAVVSGIARYVAQQGINTPIEFIFDEQEGVDDDVRLLFSHLKQSLPIEAQNLIQGAPFFKNDRDKQYMPLQAADLLAWHVRREHETRAAIPRTSMLRNKSGHLVQEIPDDVVRKWADHHSKLPGTTDLQSKGQWRRIKREIERLQAAGIDPSKIIRPGVYYPEGTPVLARMIDRVRRLFRRS
ncbi:MAG TPA: hypothetical protein VNH44_13420 [Micropepsaceae bacterium]|nr:hypothetical protein [Micropepsaceae bacterium]